MKSLVAREAAWGIVCVASGTRRVVSVVRLWVNVVWDLRIEL